MQVPQICDAGSNPAETMWAYNAKVSIGGFQPSNPSSSLGTPTIKKGSPLAQWQSSGLLTRVSLVRIQQGEPQK